MEKLAKTINIPYFRGVFMRTNLPAKIKTCERAIVNLDDASGPGTHWVSYIKKGDFVRYYDSFGVQPPHELMKYFGKNAVIDYNCDQEQGINQVICGHLSLLFLTQP